MAVSNVPMSEAGSQLLALLRRVLGSHERVRITSDDGEVLGAVISREDLELLEELRDQAWFWDAEWQAGEREADVDIRAGRLARSLSTDELLDSI